MSREIKFRAWDKEKSRWVREYDYRLEDQEDPAYEKEYGEDFGWLDGEAASDLDLVNGRLAIDRYVWEQYTGLKDKNGKEIYEGDILQQRGLLALTKVVWYENHAEFQTETINQKNTIQSVFCFDVVEADLSEVIGNVHEYPWLLGGEE